MKKITTLFVDIGGVLLTNGWEKNSRKLAAKTFHLDFDEIEERHHLTFDTDYASTRQKLAKLGLSL